jgi:hypothetical protein
VHPIIDTPEIRAIIPRWEERWMEYQLLMNQEVKDVLKQNKVDLICWKDLQ